MLKDFISQQIRESSAVKEKIISDVEILESINVISQKVIDTYNAGNKTLIAGNGGSAADAQHIAGELVSKFYFDRPALPSVALTTDTSVLTAIGNDYGYKHLFSRQVQANGNSGDLFIGLSTSGNSENIIEALMECKKMGIVTVGLTGEKGGKMVDHCDYCIKVPSNSTPRIQESHILIGHVICSAVEEALFGKGF